MSYDLARITATSKRSLPTPFGNKESFCSETLEIPSESRVDRANIYAFLCQRLDLIYLLDYYYSVPSPDGSIPNADIWPFVENRIRSMQTLYDSFTEEIQGVLAFNSAVYLGRK